MIPCPKCNNALSIIKLNKKNKNDNDSYRIQCKRCGALVVNGIGFPGEPKSVSLERIRLYEEEMNKVFSRRAE